VTVRRLAGDPLAIDLNDHLAGATAGLEVERRAAANNRTNAYGGVSDELADDIDRALEDVMRRLGGGRDRVTVVVAWGAGKAGRLKPSGRMRR
jgi:hypothetical protein